MIIFQYFVKFQAFKRWRAKVHIYMCNVHTQIKCAIVQNRFWRHFLIYDAKFEPNTIKICPNSIFNSISLQKICADKVL